MGDAFEPSSASSWKSRALEHGFFIACNFSRIPASFAKLSERANILKLSDGLSGGVKLIFSARSAAELGMSSPESNPKIVT